jgi:hypothetical protein
MAAVPIFAFLAVVLVLVIAWAVRSDRQNKRRMAQLANALGAVSSGMGGVGVCDGIAYRFTYWSGSKNRPSALKVILESPRGQPFQVIREGRVQRLSKEIGLAAEIQTGDPSFDGECYIETDAVEFTRTLLMSDAARDAVRAVFRLGFTAVRHDGQRMSALWSPFKLRDDIDPSLITGAVAALATLVRNMPMMATPARPAPTLIATGLPMAGGGMLIALIALSLFAAQFRPIDTMALMRDSLHYSVPALVLWLGFVFLQLRGRSTAYKEFGLLALLSVLSFLLGGAGVETIINGWADAGPPSVHDVEVIRTYSSSGRSTTYHIVVTSWHRPRRAENLIVSSAAYHDAQPHRRMTVVTKPGRLGFEWITSYVVKASPDSGRSRSPSG